MLTLIVWLTINQIIGLVNDLPNLQVKFEVYLNNIRGYLRRDFGISTSEQNELLGEFVKSLSTNLGDVVLSTTNAISTLVQIPIYIFLFLIYRTKIRDFILQPGAGRSSIPAEEGY